MRQKYKLACKCTALLINGHIDVHIVLREYSKADSDYSHIADKTDICTSLDNDNSEMIGRKIFGGNDGRNVE